MHSLICTTPRSNARKEMVLMAFDLNRCRNVFLTLISMVTDRLTTVPHRYCQTNLHMNACCTPTPPPHTLTPIDPSSRPRE